MSSTFLGFMLVFLAFVIERSAHGFLPTLFPLIFLGANLIAFLYYYWDKVAAIKNNWRTSESTLHLLSLAGGWGGAYMAQKLLHHKHKKTSFTQVYKLTVLVNCLAISLYAIPVLLNFIIGSLVV